METSALRFYHAGSQQAARASGDSTEQSAEIRKILEELELLRVQRTELERLILEMERWPGPVPGPRKDLGRRAKSLVT